MRRSVLLVNLGSPTAPSRSAVHRYLREFLMDARVLDIPWIARWPLVNLIIAPFRAARSARQYRAVWLEEHGSPLIHHSRQLLHALQNKLGSDYSCHLAMRYGTPAIAETLEQIRAQQTDELIVLPLYPQYASATSGSVGEEVLEQIRHWQAIPSLRIVNNWLDQAGFVNAWLQCAQDFLQGRSIQEWDHVLFSYHGLPQRQINKICPSPCGSGECPRQVNGFCYRAHCHATTRLIAEALQLQPQQYSQSFQSRLGSGWLQPYTSEHLEELASQGMKKILVFSPAFVADCLETLYELGMEAQAEFQATGGEQLDLVPSLNASTAWVDFLVTRVRG